MISSRHVSGSPPNIAVIGVGMTGVSVVHALLQKVKKGELPNNITLTVFEPRDQIATGPIYDLNLPDCCVINNTTDYMAGINIKVDDPSTKDFHLWIKERLSELQERYPRFQLDNPSGTVPRRLYGEYLAARWKELTEFAKAEGIELNVVHGLNSVRSIQGSKIVLENSAQVYDAVFLTTGHWKSSKVVGFEHAGRFIHAPYPLSTYDKVPENSKVAVVGASLTACEIALYLIEHRHAQHVTLMSRSGRMRSVRGHFRTDYVCHYMTPENIERHRVEEGGYISVATIGKLIAQEMERASGEKVNWNEIVHPSDPSAAFRANYMKAKDEPEIKTFSALLSIIKLKDQVFGAVRPEDIHVLNDYYNGVFSAYKTPMSMHEAERVLSYIDAGKLSVQGGLPFQDMASSGEIQFSAKGVSVQGQHYDWMVMGNIGSLNRGRSAKYKAMIENGILTKNDVGIDVDHMTGRANAQAAIYLIGAEKGFRSGTINNNNEASNAVNDMCKRMREQNISYAEVVQKEGPGDDGNIAVSNPTLEKIIADGPQRRGRTRRTN